MSLNAGASVLHYLSISHIILFVRCDFISSIGDLIKSETTFKNFTIALMDISLEFDFKQIKMFYISQRIDNQPRNSFKSVHFILRIILFIDKIFQVLKDQKL